ncbi:MAG: response regulator transcription factor [Candidatus Limivivens sp.]|nr:response regulator transcription factor [Candidatus Limivivens sp.]
MAKILIADDEPDIYELIRRYAQREGYETAAASDGREAVALCKEQNFDMIIMDIMMPGMDGFTACREIRKIREIPVLMLSARGTEFDKLLGFDLGIDDYVVKPFSPRELMARVNVILKRHQAQTGKNAEAAGQTEFGKLRIDPLGHCIFVDGVKTELTAKEYDLLDYLIQNKNIVLSREQILNAVWGYNCEAEDRTVDWQIKLLRGKLGVCRDFIVTMRGVGYKFEVQS